MKTKLIIALFVCSIVTIAAAALPLYAAPNAKVEQNAAIMSPVNINTASAEELQSVNGIGPTLAARIIQYREANGSFKAVEDITKVKGLGGSKFEKIKDSITV